MKITTKTAVLTVAVALAASPALAVTPVDPGSNGGQHSGSDVPSKHNSNNHGPGPHASLPVKAKAYGRYCQGFSKKHVAGTKGTPFSRCVTAMARLGSGRTDSPRIACRDLSKKHVAGTKGTPFSRCVSAGAKLLKDQEDEATS
jgi:hypothetical protein